MEDRDRVLQYRTIKRANTMRKQLEDSKLNLDGQLALRKKKQLEEVAEMNEQVEVQTKLRKR